MDAGRSRRKLAERLGVALELVAVDGAAKSVDAVANERADVGFFAIDPALPGSGTLTNDFFCRRRSFNCCAGMTALVEAV